MIPYLLAAVGGYFIGNSMKDETPSIKMSEGGYLKKYNVFGNVKVLVHAYEDETEYETTKFSVDVMALNEQEAMVMVEEQLMDEYLLNDYTTSMMGFKTYYTGEVDIDDVVEI
jgi:hypothetical protein